MAARRLVWHRRDLRLTDNPLYSKLQDSVSSTSVVSLYVFDESNFEPRPSTCLESEWNAVTVGPHAARLLVEAVTELRANIEKLGGKLIVRIGNPALIVPAIAKEVGATLVCWSEEPGVYEVETSQQVRRALERRLIPVTTHVGYTLYHPNDLPTDEETWKRLAHPKQNQKSNRKKSERKASSLQMSKKMDAEPKKLSTSSVTNVAPNRWKGLPKVMGDFRKAARTGAQVRPTIPAPSRLHSSPLSPGFDFGDIPMFERLTMPLLSKCDRPILGMNQETIRFIVKAAMDRCSNDSATRGGESWALKRLCHFVNGGYAATANRNLADVSNDNSSRLSVHLALGTISPRTIYEAAQNAGESCQWLASHLEMRDFFLYTAFSAGSLLFKSKGMPVIKKRQMIQWKGPTADDQTREQWRRWALGETKLPLVDAAMRELQATGHCSNRVRQNAASLLTKDLGIDWRAGAEWFNFFLEDHCVGSNFGNWMYFSGVGSDPKQRHFRTVSQALRYDPSGAYVLKWIPELRSTHVEGRLRPWEFVEEWSAPIVEPDTQLTWTDLERLKTHGRLSQGESDDSDTV